MTSMQLVSNNLCEYTPEFDPDTNEYYDKCPYKKHERNRPKFSCGCKSGDIIFDSITSFNQHIKSRCHKAWLHDYKLKRNKSENVERQLNIKVRQCEQQISRLINELEQWKTQASEAQRVAGEKTIKLEAVELKNVELQEANEKLTIDKNLIQEKLNSIVINIRGVID